MNTTATIAPPLPTTVPAAALDITECDRCGAAAQTRFVLPNGLDLAFCGHHTAEVGSQLVTDGATAQGITR